MPEDWEGVLGREDAGIIGTSTSAILRVTQKGTGRIAEFKDETGVLSYVDNDGNLVGPGGAAAHARQHALSAAADHTGVLGAGQHGSLADGDHTGDLNPQNVTIKGPRPYVDAQAYGFSPSASAATNNAALAAAYAALPASGGDILIPIPGGTAPYDISATWTIGDGSVTAASTKNNVRIRGVGSGVSAAETGWPGGAVRLRWTGASGGTMVQVAGPIGGMVFDGIVLDCNDLADTALDLMHPFNAYFQNLLARRHRGFAYKISAYTDPTGCVIGANNNVWMNVKNMEPTAGTTAGGIQIGSTEKAGLGLNVAQNTFIGCTFTRISNASAASMELRFTDALVFLSCTLAAAGGALGAALLVTVPTGGAVFPGGIAFYNSHLLGAQTVSGSWDSTSSGIMFLPFPTGDDPTLPSHANFRGLSDVGLIFGTMYGTPFQWTGAVAGPNTAVGTEYAYPVGLFASTSASEAFRQGLVDGACDMVRFRVYLDTAPGTTATRTFTVRKNAVDTALTVTYASGDSGEKISTATVSFAAGDRVSIGSTVGTATAAASVVRWALRIRETAA